MASRTPDGSPAGEAGPALATEQGTGPIEGLWLVPVVEGQLDSHGEFSYFLPPDSTNVPAWAVVGALMHEADNLPGEGLDGGYVTLSSFVAYHQ